MSIFCLNQLKFLSFSARGFNKWMHNLYQIWFHPNRWALPQAGISRGQELKMMNSASNSMRVDDFGIVRPVPFKREGMITGLTSV
jgi:hypothetical protein